MIVRSGSSVLLFTTKRTSAVSVLRSRNAPATTQNLGRPLSRYRAARGLIPVQRPPRVGSRFATTYRFTVIGPAAVAMLISPVASGSQPDAGKHTLGECGWLAPARCDWNQATTGRLAARLGRSIGPAQQSIGSQRVRHIRIDGILAQFSPCTELRRKIGKGWRRRRTLGSSGNMDQHCLTDEKRRNQALAHCGSISAQYNRLAV